MFLVSSAFARLSAKRRSCCWWCGVMRQHCHLLSGECEDVSEDDDVSDDDSSGS